MVQLGPEPQPEPQLAKPTAKSRLASVAPRLGIVLLVTVGLYLFSRAAPQRAHVLVVNESQGVLTDVRVAIADAEGHTRHERVEALGPGSSWDLSIASGSVTVEGVSFTREGVLQAERHDRVGRVEPGQTLTLTVTHGRGLTPERTEAGGGPGLPVGPAE